MIVVLSSVSPLRFLSALRAFAVNNPVEGQDVSQDHRANKKPVEKQTPNPAQGSRRNASGRAEHSVNSSTGCVISRVAGSAEGWSC
jgi:hypothetical protein